MLRRKAQLGWWSVIAVVVVAGGRPLCAAENRVDPDADFLRKAKIGTDGASLLALLKKQVGDEATISQVRRLIQQLGENSFKLREQATKKIIAMGPCARLPLRTAQKGLSLEIAHRARMCLREINKAEDLGQIRAAVRLLLRKPIKGTVKGLLNCLPWVTDDETEEEIWYGLDAIGMREGKAHPALVKALTNSFPARRALAACILGRKGNEAERRKVRALLKDADAMVRLRAAQGLLAGKESVAVPTLIGLLAEPSIDIAWQAEELLHWVAGNQAPRITIGNGTRTVVKQCRAAWEHWWQRYRHRADFAHSTLPHHVPRLVMVCEQYFEGQEHGRVWLCGCDEKPRWQLDNVIAPSDAQLLAKNRMLIADERKGVVSERQIDGTMVWSTACAHPVACQRLPNGDTFVLMKRGRAFQINTEDRLLCHFEFGGKGLSLSYGKLVSRQQLLGVGFDKPKGSKKRQYSFFVVDIDPTNGKERERIDFADSLRYPWEHIQPLRNGRFLLTSRALRIVVEMDKTGKVQRVCRHTSGTCAVRLRNGNTIVAYGSRNEGGLREVDRQNGVVWEARGNSSPRRMHLCLQLVQFGF